jgi:hypothetical protein
MIPIFPMSHKRNGLWLLYMHCSVIRQEYLNFGNEGSIIAYCLLVTQRKHTESTFITEMFTSSANSKKWLDNQLFYWNSWNFTCYCIHLILGTISIFNQQVAGSFNCLDLACQHLHCRFQVTTTLRSLPKVPSTEVLYSTAAFIC